MVKVFNDDNFSEEVLEASKEKPVLVDFFAVWCGPCQAQGPVMEEVSEEAGNKAVVGKLNIDEAQEIAEKYGVMSIPTIILFKYGQVKETLTGLQAKENLLKLFE